MCPTKHGLTPCLSCSKWQNKHKRRICTVEDVTVRRAAFSTCGTVHTALIGRRTMKSLDVKQDSADGKPDLVTRSYSPLLRVLVVGAIFIVAVFVLAACGSKAKTAASASSTPTQSNAVTPSASTSVASALTCKADTSSDSINVGTYFGNILAQAKKDWRPDANISSVRFEAPYDKNFNSLCTLRTDGNWKIILYSVSSKSELVAGLDIFQKKNSEMPLVRYEVIKKLADNTNSYSSRSIAEMKKEGGWIFYTYSRPETAASEAKGPSNLFLTWKMSMSQVIQKFIDRTRSEKITGAGYNIAIGKASLKTQTPYVDIYWENGSKKQAYYVEPISLKIYEVKY